MQRKSDKSLSAVDLFSGCGGLTVGLKRAGFDVVAGVEVEEHAFTTYKVNHPEVHVYLQDVRTIKGKELAVHSRSGEVDLLAGCPPCQGFSSLTSKWRRSDPRDDLVDDMGRIAIEIRPKVIMMENVPGLAQKGRPIFDRLLRRLKRVGYQVSWDVLQVADYGVPQRRRRLVMVAGLGFEITLPKPTHSRTAEGGLPKWRTLRDTIAGMPRAVKLSKAVAEGGPAAFDWHVVRELSRDNQRRLQHARPGRSWSSIPKHLRPKCHRGTVRQSGFSNVYGRMRWDEPSVTITGGCTTLSKGRFGHPKLARTISVREAALLQTFPRDYLFDVPYMEYACDMIGNALPCDFAAVIAKACKVALLRHQRSGS